MELVPGGEILLRFFGFCPHQRRQWELALYADLRVAGRGGRKRKAQFEHRSFFRGFLHHHIPPVILDNLLYDRQAQTGAVFLTLADKRFEELVPDGQGYSVPVIRDSDFDGIKRPVQVDVDVSPFPRDGLTGIEQQVIEDVYKRQAFSCSGNAASYQI